MLANKILHYIGMSVELQALEDAVRDFKRDADLDFVDPKRLAAVIDEASARTGIRPRATYQVSATVDYGLVARRIVEIGTKNRVNLIERLAGLIIEALLREFPAREIRVRVRKLTPPMEGLVGTPSVELTRSRS